MKHWTYFLPEAGILTRHGEDQVLAAIRIEEKKKELAYLKEMFREVEEEIEQLARMDWTTKQIKIAKQKAIKANKGKNVVAKKKRSKKSIKNLPFITDMPGG